MNAERLFFLFAGLFFVLFAVFNVTNIGIEWGKPIMGFSAGIAGVLCLLRAIKGI